MAAAIKALIAGAREDKSMTDYSQMSDRDIDALVLQKIYGNQASDKDIMRAWLRGGFKYTKNPADAWPIIVESRINMTTHVDCWKAERNGFCFFNENPLRAAMIVFLMMKGAIDAPAI
jgi:hypothetical protein